MSSYLIYDEFGLKTVLCICCGVSIKSRQEIRSLLDPKVIIREISKHANYCEIPMILDDGKIAFIMACDGCKFEPMKPETISDKLTDALREQLKYEGKLPDMIDAIIMGKKFNVKRKAETDEVMAVLRGK